MERKRRQAVVVGIGLIFIIIILTVLIIVIKKFTPSKEIMELTEYYPVSEGEILMIMQDSIYEKKGLYIDGAVYIDFDTVTNHFNKRFYWDNNENVLIYTLPNAVIKAEAGSSDYYIDRSKNRFNCTIARVDGEQVYISLDFVKQYSNIEYEIFDSPNRIVIDYKWNTDYLYTEVKKPTQLRAEPSIKSDILVQLSKDTKLQILETEEESDTKFTSVITEDGVIGYVKSNKIGESYYETLKNDYEEPVYTHILKDYKINMVWHQVFNQDANNNLLTLIDRTKGVNTISPTWFSVKNVEGEITSLASETYVERAHNAGMEVWGLVNDFGENVEEFDMFDLLSYTSRREKLENALLAEAIKYSLDGINIDFENISKKAGKHYIQFIRELSVKCRNNGIVLSIDNYVPSDYSMYYDRAEQAAVADYVITMAYDEHYAGSEESGSVASIGFVRSAIENSLTMVPKEQLIIAIPFYTRLWQEEKLADGTIKISAESYSMQGGINKMTDNNVQLSWDEETGQYYGEYEANGYTYKMWLEEEESIDLKMKAIYENDVAGVAGWKLSLEREGVWNIITKYIN